MKSTTMMPTRTGPLSQASNLEAAGDETTTALEFFPNPQRGHAK